MMCLVRHIKDSSISALLPFFLCYESSQTDERGRGHLDYKIELINSIVDSLLKIGKEEFDDDVK